VQPEQTYDPSEFQGKRVLLTGETKGIGAAMKRLNDGGAVVATTARSLPTTASSDRFNSVGGSTTPCAGALVFIRQQYQESQEERLPHV
jgi:NAD(P)-dependent dehydrogenase (short-subunit alcohol dehydrogenase family)